MTEKPSRTGKTRTRDVDQDLSTADRKVSYEEFFEWAPDSRIAEWVNGEIVMPSPPRFGHQDISDFLAAVLRIYTQAFDVGQVISAPFQVKPGVDFPGREPDILFLVAPHGLEEDTPRLERAPDMAVEIISPGTEGTDREDKFLEYAAAGVREYWLISGLEQWAEFYRLNEAGKYELALSGSAGMFRSEVIEGFVLEVSWLWQVPRPRPELVVLEIAGLDYAREVLRAATSVLPANELASALPAVLTTLPADVVAQTLPDVLATLPLELLVDTLAKLSTSLPPSARAKLRDALS